MQRTGHAVPTDWSWVVAPMSSSTLPTFHRYYDDFDTSPTFHVQSTAFDVEPRRPQPRPRQRSRPTIGG